MFGALARKIFGSANDRRLKTYAPKVAAINALEAEVSKLTDDQLRARTDAGARLGPRPCWPARIDPEISPGAPRPSRSPAIPRGAPVRRRDGRGRTGAW